MTEDLQARLAAAEQTLAAIYDGAADALVVPTAQGPQIYTLESSDAFYRALVERMSEGAAAVRRDGLVLFANAAFARLIGRELHEVIGGDLAQFVSPQDQGALADLLARRVSSGDLRLGSTAVTHVKVSTEDIVAGGAAALSFVAIDQTERLLIEERLRWVADHDALTGLLNRRGFELALQHQLAVSRRHSTGGALILFDVDHFKYINDARGHQVGDTVLIAVAGALGSRLREGDTFARLGGDEFALVVPHGDLSAAQALAEKLVAETSQIQLPELAGMRQLTISVGVAPLSPDRTAGELMAQADLAMYDAKEAGRNQAVVYDSTVVGGSGTERRLTWLTRIRSALEAGELRLHAQPIVDLATGEAVLHELLVRLPGLDGAPVPASSWFEVAERYDLASAVDRWVFSQALDLLQAHPDMAFSINLSATSIGRAGLLDHLREGVAELGLDPGRLTIEITETAALTNMGAAARFVEQIRDLGFRLALDDFGAGYGSFSYLKHLPFDDVKIDGEFVRNSVNDPRDQAIIRAMVDVARAMGRRTIAESIEDQATLELMRAQGVDLVQGYFVGMPRELAG